MMIQGIFWILVSFLLIIIAGRLTIKLYMRTPKKLSAMIILSLAIVMLVTLSFMTIVYGTAIV